MTDQGDRIVPEDLLLAIDTAMMQLAVTRRLVERFISTPTTADGSCKHLNTVETFSETICTDCGETLATTAENDDGVSSGG